MKRSGFKQMTFEEAREKQRAARERAQERYKKKLKTAPKPKPKKKPKKDRVKSLKTRLWAAFSRYIRARHADRNGMVETCDGKWMHWKETHCGHLYTNSERNQSLGGNELWYYENNFAPQSSMGNYFNADDSAKRYMLWAVKRYGQDEIDRMFRMKQTPRRFTEEELEEKLLYYKQEFDKLNV